MRGLRKSICFSVCAVILFSLIMTTAFAVITVKPIADCAPENQMFQTWQQFNSHASTADQNYPNVFCYESITANDAGADTLLYPDQETLNNCWGNNVLLRATSEKNAHVAVPHTYLTNADQYQTDLCYGYLQCSVNANPGPHEQPLAKLSGNTNAHLSDAATTDPRFAVQVSCWEPICDITTFNEKTPFPNLYTFDENKRQFEFPITGSISESGSFERPQTPIAQEALKITLGDDQEFALDNIRITDWSGYAYFEFFVRFTDKTFFDKVLLTVGDAQPLSLYQYAKTAPKENAWIKIRVPVTEAQNTVNSLSFRVENSNFEISFFVDSMTFIPKSETNNQFDAYYCAQSEDTLVYTWVDDADDNAVACDNINGFSYTGNGCCGDDANEFFNGNNGSCFDSTYIPNNTVFDKANDANNQLCIGDECPGSFVRVNESYSYANNLHYGYTDGTLYSCGVNEQALKTDENGQVLVTQEAYATPVSYITNPSSMKDGDACVVVGDFFCSPKGYFSNQIDNVIGEDVYEDGVVVEGVSTQIASAGLRTFLRKDAMGQGYTCCPQNYCNYEGTCYEDTSNEPWDEGIEMIDPNGETIMNRCIQGEWSKGTLKTNFDGSEYGYCPSANDCFVSERGTSEDPNSPTCIASNTQYYDNYCAAGKWTSRTKVLAEKLVSSAVANEQIEGYTLFCDDFEKTLNYLGVLNEVKVEEILRGAERQELNSLGNACGVEGCVNNFCVLNPTSGGDTLHFGTSINNIAISNTTYGIGAIFGLVCDDNPNSDGYISCDSESGDGNWYFYPDTDIIIYKAPNGGLISGIIDNLGDFFGKLWQILPFTDEPNGDLPDVFDKVQLYNRVYVQHSQDQDDIQIQGYTERIFDKTELRYVDALVISYQSKVVLNICGIVDSFKSRLTDEDALLTCVETQLSDGYQYTIISTSTDIEEIWVELTAKLRTRN